jgi:hypothetical protein
MWQWLEPHDLYWRRVSSKMHSHLHTKDNQGECFVPPSGVFHRFPITFCDTLSLRRRNAKTLRHYSFCILDSSKIWSEITALNVLTLIPSCRLRRNNERPRRMPCSRFPLQSLRRLQRHKTRGQQMLIERAGEEK